jgi:hypothetical protein
LSTQPKTFNLPYHNRHPENRFISIYFFINNNPIPIIKTLNQYWSIFTKARTKQTCRKPTGGLAPRRQRGVKSITGLVPARGSRQLKLEHDTEEETEQSERDDEKFTEKKKEKGPCKITKIHARRKRDTDDFFEASESPPEHTRSRATRRSLASLTAAMNSNDSPIDLSSTGRSPRNFGEQTQNAKITVPAFSTSEIIQGAESSQSRQLPAWNQIASSRPIHSDRLNFPVAPQNSLSSFDSAL